MNIEGVFPLFQRPTRWFMNDLSKVSIKRIEGLDLELADLYDKIEEASKTGTAHNVGQVFWSQSNSKDENPGALPLFTGENVAVADYDALHRFLLRNSSLVKSKADYDALIADTSVDCPYYAIDNGRIYLPLLRNYLNVVYVEQPRLVRTPYYAWCIFDENDEVTETVYTGVEEPAVGDDVYTDITMSANGEITAVGENQITAYISIREGEFGYTKTYTRYGQGDTVREYSVGEEALHVNPTPLYPWVSYVTTLYDIVTPTEYAKADLTNVESIPADSPVQAKLTAGSNVTITNNTISATDTTYTAGTGISISNGVIDCTVNPTPLWGNITGTLTDQTDLTAYISQQIGASGMLGRINYNAAVSNGLTYTISSSDGHNYVGNSSTYTVPADGYINVVAYLSITAIQLSTTVLSGTHANLSNRRFLINNAVVATDLSNDSLVPVSAGDIIECRFDFTLEAGTGGSPNGSTVVTFMFYPQK